MRYFYWADGRFRRQRGKKHLGDTIKNIDFLR